MLKLALLVGGPSPEAGISLNSARSVADHLESEDIAISVVVYFDRRSQPHHISRSLLYSNTPEDFDFKLSLGAPPLTSEGLAQLLGTCDMAFPVMHGELGEDGGVQRLLEGIGLPYVGSGPEACARAYDKYSAFVHLGRAGLEAVPSVLLDGTHRASAGLLDELRRALGAGVDAEGRFVLKPARGGSSIGVSVLSRDEAVTVMAAGPSGEADGQSAGRQVLQPYVAGREFTVVVLEGPDGPVALPPVEVERRRPSPAGILSYQDKYLASDDVRYYCPPRPSCPEGMVAALRSTAEHAFRALGLSDFARIDCWALPDQRVLVSDVNPISGMEQNSYLFIQASQVGMSHADVLRVVVSVACRRQQLPVPGPARSRLGTGDDRFPVAVLFGGGTAERQVSVLSGTNVWLKLARSHSYVPRPFLLCSDADDQGTVWALNYAVALRHSVEAIAEACRLAPGAEPRRRMLADDARQRLGLSDADCSLTMALPKAVPLEEVIASHPFVFIALHGGQGEDGTLQRFIEDKGVAYNGSGPEASSLCIDKYRTSVRLAPLLDQGIRTARKTQVEVASADRHKLWEQVVKACGTSKVIVKPLADGCSAGVVPLASSAQLDAYLEAVDHQAERFLIAGTGLEIEMPPGKTTHLLFEEYFETDDVAIVASPSGLSQPGPGSASSRLAWAEERDTGWVEVTVGVLGTRGAMRALSPSVTVAQRGVLSLQEKFMGGTGVNITPPPAPPLGRVSPTALTRAKHLVEMVANELGIEGYARIDAFMHRDRGDVLIIEANTLPGLTPSTVLYHQALAEVPPMFPRDFLERVIELGLARHSAGAVGQP